MTNFSKSLKLKPMNDKVLTNKFKGLLGEYEITPTEDGSHTLFSQYFNEGCHSLAGAKSETLYNYFEGTQVESFYKQDGSFIFEVGFGLGVGYQVTTEELNPQEGQLVFISGELDEGLLTYAKENIQTKEGFPQFKDLEKKTKEGLTYYEARVGHHRLMILIGNLRQTLVLFQKLFPELKVNSIYQDPFSPKRNPDLWTYQWFEQLKAISGPKVVMSTYSSSNSIRKAMIKAGWSLKNAKGFGPKKLSTRAYLQGHTEQGILDKLERSPTPPMSD